jgi:hypothetical protein
MRVTYVGASSKNKIKANRGPPSSSGTPQHPSVLEVFLCEMCQLCLELDHPVFHDVAVECVWRAFVERSAEASTREPAAAHLLGDAVLDPALVNGKRVDFHVFDTSAIFGFDVTIVDPTCPYLWKSESVLFREAEQAKTSMC